MLRALLVSLVATASLAPGQAATTAAPKEFFVQLREQQLLPANEAGFVVEVVDPDGKPVADAEVHVLNQPPERAVRDQLHARQLAEPGFERVRLLPFLVHGHHYRTGGDGTVRVLGTRRVFAWHGERLGVAQDRSKAGEPLRVVLRPRAVAAVTAKDHDGKPVAGLGLSLYAIGRADLAAMEFAVEARTAADGTASLPFCRDLVRTGPGAYAGVRTDVVGPLVHASLEFDASDHDARVQLVLPPLGQVRVLARDGDRLRQDLTEVGLRWTRRPHTRAEMPPIAPARVDAEGAWFPFVALDCELKATAQTPDGKELVCVRKGPTKAGETVTFELLPP